MKLCIHCQYARRIGNECECWHENNQTVSPVHGRKIARVSCAYLRETKELCGPEGKWYHAFQPKDAA